MTESTSRPHALARALTTSRESELIAIARGKGEDAARLAAIAALGRIASVPAETCLSEILKGEAPDAVRAAAFRALRRLQRSKVVRYDETQDQERGQRGAVAADFDDEDFDDEDLDDDEDFDDEDFDDEDDEEEQD